ncbi:uncharacterized protein VICG_01782 [Vittaforma corneae ATCC 50505]|uniref:SAM-dependent MTase RsmB/NOP-type domain-containing protein n=1 Tax=Vittaforma corneae (strain ATCC 50505) TaxID=993615 RepID=L2GJX9_VITCO|nr:uncharacterized protein VICG_01782 [Vittaforma corneae ATCC 50505]ELA41183.1 hypothetical protein VICG_01782 [Vittaforma corneae ATCC 50505]
MPLQEFIEFYQKHLNLDPTDLQKFTDSIQSPLSSAFRITPTQHSSQIKERLEKYKFLKKIQFLEDVYTFDLKAHKNTDEYTEFIELLVAQTDVGNIQRQEVVSLLPHKFLQLKHSHRVLETCASPGSKTKNLLENITDGILISNEKSSSRVNILISESAKKATPSFIITQMDAAHFPTLNFKFDRICCDVPCSSDGTCRKNPAIMPKWNVNDGIGLSSIQLRILKRSLELLKEGGILVYSTCSLNPIENEWVIHNAIRDNPNYELINNFDFIQYVDSCAVKASDNSKINVRRGLVEFEYKQFHFKNEHLSKCFRILPHDQDTGGFFIAVIKKVADSCSKVFQPVNVINPRFVEVDSSIESKIKKCYDISKCNYHFVSSNLGFKNIFAVSDLCYSILCNNPKLKVSYAGIKAFTHFDIDKEKFRAKSPFLEISNISTDFTLSLEDFKKLLESKHIPLDKLGIRPAGLFSCKVEGTDLRFCGFSGGMKVFLYIDDNHRKAYSQLYCVSNKHIC